MEHTILTLDERITALEMRITFQDNTIEELNGVVTDLRSQLDHLTQNMKAVSDKVSSAFINDDKDTKPPHY